MADFQIDPRLSNDSFAVDNWQHCHVRLMNDSRFPWLLMIPRAEGLKDLHDLPEAMWEGVSLEIHQASRALMRATGAEKMNVASLGNMVPQLHIHVIARFESDDAWPGPVWGVGRASPYTGNNADRIVTKFTDAMTRETN